jgi:hypothetical protein
MTITTKSVIVTFLPFLFAGCIVTDLIEQTLTVPCDPTLLPAISPAEPLLPGEACLRLPADEAAWVNRSEMLHPQDTTFAVVHLGEITRQAALHVLKSSFAGGTTETPGPAPDRVDVYAKVDQFQFNFDFPMAGEKLEPHTFATYTKYYKLHLTLTVRFTTPEGRLAWEHTYDSGVCKSRNIAKLLYERLPIDKEPSRLFQETVVSLMLEAVRDYGRTMPATPAASVSATAPTT